jgi:dGTPase
MKNLSADPNFANRNNQSEKEHEFRNKFARDRDRILYSTEFRRLDRKTQVFVSSFDDNNRNRLTHTIEVVQIAKTISKYFNLNQELTEAIAFAHDVGHTPFGHTGERTLNLILNGCNNLSYFERGKKLTKGFKHNWQSLRVVTKLEKISDSFDGLNLTDFTLWGMLHHTNRFYDHDDECNIDFAGDYLKINKCDYFSENNSCTLLHKNKICHSDGEHYLDFYTPLAKIYNNSSWTIEALVVRIADEKSQRHHDIEDGINAKIIDNKELVDL